MAKQNYSERSVINSFRSNREIEIDIVNKTISIAPNPTTLGSKSWGKISYLEKVHKYIVLYNVKLNKKVFINNTNDSNNFIKTFKRDKLNERNIAKNKR